MQICVYSEYLDGEKAVQQDDKTTAKDKTDEAEEKEQQQQQQNIRLVDPQLPAEGDEQGKQA